MGYAGAMRRGTRGRTRRSTITSSGGASQGAWHGSQSPKKEALPRYRAQPRPADHQASCGMRQVSFTHILIGSGKFASCKGCPDPGGINSDLRLQASENGPVGAMGRKGRPVTDPFIAGTYAHVPHNNSSLRYPIERLRKQTVMNSDGQAIQPCFSYISNPRQGSKGRTEARFGSCP